MLRDKVIDLFVPADHSCKELSGSITLYRLEKGEAKHRNRDASLSDSDIIVIHLKDCFSNLLSYNRFIERQQPTQPMYQ